MSLIDLIRENINLYRKRENEKINAINQLNSTVNELLNKSMNGDTSEWIQTINNVHNINSSYSKLVFKIGDDYIKKTSPDLKKNIKRLNERLLEYNS